MSTTTVERSVSSYRDVALLVGRILLAALFLIAFYMSAVNISGTTQYFTSLGLPAPEFMVWLKMLIELVGGICLLIGWQTRLAALGLALFVLIAALIAHTRFGDANQLNHFLKNIAIAGGLLALYVSGPGTYSVEGKS